MALALNGAHPHFASPRADSIARWILTAWVAGDIAEADTPC
jgi:hypothetical protein